MKSKMLLAQMGIDPEVDCVAVFKYHGWFGTWVPRAARNFTSGLPVQGARMLGVAQLTVELDNLRDRLDPILKTAMADWLRNPGPSPLVPVPDDHPLPPAFPDMVDKLKINVLTHAVMVLKADGQVLTYIPNPDLIRRKGNTDEAHLYFAIGVDYLLRHSDHYMDLWNKLLRQAIPGYKKPFPSYMPLLQAAE